MASCVRIIAQHLNVNRAFCEDQAGLRVSQEMIQGWRRWHKTLLCFPTQWKHRNPGTEKKRVAVRTHLSTAQRSVYSASCSDSICNLAEKGLIRATKRAFAHIYGAKPRFGCNGSTAYFDTHPPPQKISFGITSKPNIVAPPIMGEARQLLCWSPPASHLTPPWVSVLPTQRYSDRVSLLSLNLIIWFYNEAKKRMR